MPMDQETHVEPIALWKSACLRLDLSHRDRHHVMVCPACDTLAMEMVEALHEIEKTMSRTYPNGSS